MRHFSFLIYTTSSIVVAMVTGAVLSVVLTSCSSKSPSPDYSKVRIWNQPFVRNPAPNEIISTNPPRRINETDLIDNLARTNVVYVGEQHDDTGSHRVQLRILKKLHKKQGQIAVGFELFRQNYQDLLSRVFREKLTLRTFKNKLEANNGQGNLFEYYRPILKYARKHSLPLLALKPTRESENRVRQQSKEASDTGNGSHHRSSDEVLQTRFLKEIFKDHVPTGRGFGSFVTVQRFWEHRMASNIHSYLRETNNPKRILILTGNYHVAYDFGIPDQLRERGNWIQTSILTVPVDKDLKDFLRYPSIDGKKAKLADYIWWVTSG